MLFMIFKLPNFTHTILMPIQFKSVFIAIMSNEFVFFNYGSPMKALSYGPCTIPREDALNTDSFHNGGLESLILWAFERP